MATICFRPTHRHLHLFIEMVPVHVLFDWHVDEADVGNLSVIAATAAVADAADDNDGVPVGLDTSLRPVP